jgi:hypothetical protein
MTTGLHFSGTAQVSTALKDQRERLQVNYSIRFMTWLIHTVILYLNSVKMR